MIKFTAQADGAIKELLQLEYPEMSGRKIKNLIQYSQIEINGKLLSHPTHAIKKGSEVVVQKRSRPEVKFPFRVYYDDEYMVIAEKPAGLLTSAPPGTLEDSFLLQMNEVFKEEKGERLFPVHRLDREVAGLVVLAKDERTQEYLKEHWPEGRKKYYALTEGTPPKKEDKIISWLYEDSRQIVHSSDKEVPGSKKAVTHYKVLETRQGRTLLELELETGRKNQLRVHMSSIGCPILGDYRYGADKEVKRQIRLYAYFLRVPHPNSDKQVKIERPLPGFFWKYSSKDEKYK